MRQIIYIASLMISTGCYSQVEYFSVKDVVDRTDELSNKKVAWTLLGDKERVDGYTKIGDSIFGGEVACNIAPLKGVDVPTFEVWPGTKYAKDKNHVYFPIEIFCVDYEDCGVCYYREVVVGGANPLKFKCLGKEYATDGTFAYFRGKLIKGADGATFNLVESPELESFFFAKDKNNVYTFEKIFDGADPSTFHYSTKNTENSISGYDDGKCIIADKNNEWEYTPPSQFIKIK